MNKGLKNQAGILTEYVSIVGYAIRMDMLVMPLSRMLVRARVNGQASRCNEAVHPFSN